jgi:hypothetical protein
MIRNWDIFKADYNPKSMLLKPKNVSGQKF